MAELSDVRDQLAGTEAAIQDRVSLERLTPDELSMLINWVEQTREPPIGFSARKFLNVLQTARLPLL